MWILSAAAVERNSICILMKNVRARWPTAMADNQYTELHEKSRDSVQIDRFMSLTLNNLNIDFLRGKLIGLIGSGFWKIVIAASSIT